VAGQWVDTHDCPEPLLCKQFKTVSIAGPELVLVAVLRPNRVDHIWYKERQKAASLAQAEKET
jgi:hypothetical protein